MGVSIEIKCDGAGCVGGSAIPAGLMPGEDIPKRLREPKKLWYGRGDTTHALDAAMERGWQIDGDRALCPRCLEDSTQSREDAKGDHDDAAAEEVTAKVRAQAGDVVDFVEGGGDE